MSTPSPEPAPSSQPHRVEAADVAAWLESLAADRGHLAALPDAMRERLLRACGQLARPDRLARNAFNKARRRRDHSARRVADEAVLDRTGIRVQRLELVYPTPDVQGDGPAQPGLADAPSSPGRLHEARSCYICKADYRDVHHFYDAMCPDCAEFNFVRRHQSADLSGRVALLTGGRVKIGYQAGIKLLRAGARLVVTTRFPRDAAERYAREPDFAQWQERLDVYGLDLRHTPSVEALCAHLARNYERLDVILNNACQTVRRPPGFYAHLMQGEERPYAQLPAEVRALLAEHERLRGEGRLGAASGGRGARAALGTPDDAADAARDASQATDPLVHASWSAGRPAELAGLRLSAALSQLALVDGDDDAREALFPAGALDADLQQVDLRDVNSWRLPLAAVPTVELLEVTLVNAIAPFVLNARLKPLMLRTPGRDKHIVNVSAMEGQFYRAFKTDKHPHTNMAKAALNMLTRTSAPDYQRDGIHMNSVDTGWITDEDPAHISRQKREEHGFHPPLDHVDAAARICAPVFDGFNTGEHVWGQFLKDYRPAPW
ncbi:MAG: SDR family oxidoreductase [Planctomycetes bacterium]|nr:SDR family oxidoreductase [Planctomycetota bacterium]